MNTGNKWSRAWAVYILHHILDEMQPMLYNIEKNENYQEFLQKGILQECGDKTTLNPDFYGINNYIIIRLLP